MSNEQAIAESTTKVYLSNIGVITRSMGYKDVPTTGQKAVRTHFLYCVAFQHAAPQVRPGCADPVAVDAPMPAVI